MRQGQSIVLVGDIGGTSARFAIAEISHSTNVQLRLGLSLKSADYDSLQAAIIDYLARVKAIRPPQAVIAVAGPVIDGTVKLTNLSWCVSESALREMGFEQARVINDFRALAVAAEGLKECDLAPIGRGAAYNAKQNVALIGPGTGLGVAALVHDDGTPVPVSSEGGHVGFAPADEREAEIVRILFHRFGHVSAERVVSGPGLVNIHGAIRELGGKRAELNTPAEIVEGAKAGDPSCRETVAFCIAALAAVAGDVALTFCATGGVLLTGGVTAALRPFIDSDAFRARFEAKGRLSAYLKNIPTFLIIREDAALLGCAKSVAQRPSMELPDRQTTESRKDKVQTPQTKPEAANATRGTMMIPLVIFLFFAWGFTTSLNDPLIAKLKGLFSLSYTEVMLTQFAFFLGYFVFSIPAGIVLNKLGYIRAIAAGLTVMACGCLLFAPAAMAGLYSGFLGALFIVAAGMALLQVAANPYIAVLGSAKNASSRLTFAQSFNSLGTFFGPLVGALVLLSRGVDAPRGADEAALQAARVTEASFVQTPFLIIAAVLLCVALVFWLLRRMPTPPTDAADINPFSRRVLSSPRLLFGVAAIFLYVGAEVAIGSGLTNYLMQPNVIGGSAAGIGRQITALLSPIFHRDFAFNAAQVAGAMVSIYWGLAMVGRFIGSGVLALVKPGKVLAFNALLALVLALVSSQTTGFIAAVTVLAIGLANSIMFPTIFTLALDGLGEDTSKGSALLCTAIVGGALIPLGYGAVADHRGLAVALFVPVVCYALIAVYGWLASRGEARANV